MLAGVGARVPSIEAGDDLSIEIDFFLDGLVESGFSGAVLVAKDGVILHHEGYGLADDTNRELVVADTVFGFGSITKQFTSAAILHVQSSGQLDTNDRITTYLADVPADKKEITIHQLLTHSAGLRNNVFASDFDDIPRDKAIGRILEEELVFTPGTAVGYSDDGYKLLAAIVEVASGQSWQSYLRDHLFEPAGMSDTGFFGGSLRESGPVATGYASGHDQGSPDQWPEPSWSLIGAGGVMTTVGDMYRWWEALHDGRVLSENAVEQLLTPHERISGRASFGYGWTIVETEDRGILVEITGAGSSHNAYFHSSLDDDLVVIVASNRIDEPLLSRLAMIELDETIYAVQVGDALVEGFSSGVFTTPDFARPDVTRPLRPTTLGLIVAASGLMILLAALTLTVIRVGKRPRPDGQAE